MKKTLLTTVLAATLFTTGFDAINANASTISTYVYQFKQTGKHVKLTSSKHIQTSKHLTKGKEINYYGAKYYYSKQVNGYLLSTDFNHKKTEKAKVTKHQSNNDTNNTSGSSNSNQSDVIKNGFDETTSTVTDKDTYINVFTQTVLNDINMYRTQKGLQPVTNSQQLQSVASVRAQQELQYAPESWYKGHFNQEGQALGDLEAVKQGIFPDYTEAQYHLSENTGAYSLNPSSTFEDPITTGHNAVKLAIDEGPNGGHYQNMMSSNAKQIGIGLYIGPNQGANTEVGYAEEYTH